MATAMTVLLIIYGLAILNVIRKKAVVKVRKSEIEELLTGSITFTKEESKILKAVKNDKKTYCHIMIHIFYLKDGQLWHKIEKENNEIFQKNHYLKALMKSIVIHGLAYDKAIQYENIRIQNQNKLDKLNGRKSKYAY